MKIRPSALALTLAGCCLALTACASRTPRTEGPDAARTLADIRPGQYAIYDTTVGQRLTLDELADRAAASDVVLLGELHSHPVGLAVASRLWDGVLERRPDAVLSMEFFERDQQAALDDYLGGVTDEAAFREAARKTKESSYPPGHRAMVEAAKAAGRPVVAANSPRRYASLARTQGLDRYDTFTPEQRRLVTPPGSISDSAYRDRFLGLMSGMGGHGGEPMDEDEARAMAESFFRAQAVWDATMGESIARATDLGAPVVHVVGRFHVAHPHEGGGLTQEVRDRLSPGARLLVVVVEDSPPGALDDETRALGDVVVLVGAPDSEAE